MKAYHHITYIVIFVFMLLSCGGGSGSSPSVEQDDEGISSFTQVQTALSTQNINDYNFSGIWLAMSEVSVTYKDSISTHPSLIKGSATEKNIYTVSFIENGGELCIDSNGPNRGSDETGVNNCYPLLINENRTSLNITNRLFWREATGVNIFPGQIDVTINSNRHLEVYFDHIYTYSGGELLDNGETIQVSKNHVYKVKTEFFKLSATQDYRLGTLNYNNVETDVIMLDHYKSSYSGAGYSGFDGSVTNIVAEFERINIYCDSPVNTEKCDQLGVITLVIHHDNKITSHASMGFNVRNPSKYYHSIVYDGEYYIGEMMDRTGAHSIDFNYELPLLTYQGTFSISDDNDGDATGDFSLQVIPSAN